jgi:hypothetical protein
MCQFSLSIKRLIIAPLVVNEPLLIIKLPVASLLDEFRITESIVTAVETIGQLPEVTVEGIKTISEVPGTPVGSQFAAVLQSESVVPVHVFEMAEPKYSFAISAAVKAPLYHFISSCFPPKCLPPASPARM